MTLDTKHAKNIIKTARKAFEEGHLNNSSLFLPLFKIGGSTFTLNEHYMMEPMFAIRRPKRTLFKCARQLGKSYSLCGRILLSSWFNPYYRSLIVLPRHEQAKKLSSDIMRNLIFDSPVKSQFFNRICKDSVLERSFINGSLIYFSYAFLDADKVRGISGIHDLTFDEVQDINEDFIPVIGEVLSAVKSHGYMTYTGTPKSLDNTISGLWEDSSQAEWVIKCLCCGKYNIPDADHHILKMIGTSTVICAHCGKPLDCSVGAYVHKFPERRNLFSGYHIPQIIHPIHYSYPMKWSEIIYKMRKYDKSLFFNEVLGLECDSSEKLLTITDLEAACANAKTSNTIEQALCRRGALARCSFGIDWGGGGGESTSFTTVAVGGYVDGSGRLECIYLEKFPKSLTTEEEVKRICWLLSTFKPDTLAHDYTGAGSLRETMLIQAGVPLSMITPYTYIGTTTRKNIISYNPPTEGYRHSYSLDKTRSLLLLCEAIKAGYILFPTWDSSKEFDNGLEKRTVLLDFLYIHKEYMDIPGRSAILKIVKNTKKSDDIVHAVNYMASALWYDLQRYPDISAARGIGIDAI